MKGIDVSQHNGNIDWAKVKNSGIEFAIIRLSFGQRAIDKKAIQNIEGCINAGLPFGVYTYSYALNVDNAINEANLVINTLAPYKDKVQFPIVIDMEDADGYKRRYGMPSNDTLVAICEKECLMFEEAGYYAMIYASKSWFDTKLNSERLNRFDKWMAWWSVSASEKFDHNTYGIWQYSDRGNVDGISGSSVDMNMAFKDYPAKINAMHNPQPQVQPTPVNMPVQNTPSGTTLELAEKTLRGEFGNGDTRKNNLGTRYQEVQDFINHIASADTNTLANEVKNGKYGNGDTRKVVLGDKYQAVQNAINKASQPSYVLYKVKAGDTLSKIAAKYGTSYEKIARDNGIANPNKIGIGAILKIHR